MSDLKGTSYKKSSFGPAFFFLSKREREALATYYEFCRKMDDIADEPNVKDPLKELNFWRKEIEAIYLGNPTTFLGQQLERCIKEFKLPKDRFLLLIEGMEADVQGKEYSSLKELEGYLYRVAIIVGQATLDILGEQSEKAKELAWLLGRAVQLTNIIRDVTTDATLGRVYIPLDILEKGHLTKQEVLAMKSTEKISYALKELSIVAEGLYQEAFTKMKEFSKRKVLPCRIMGCVYALNLAKIKRSEFIYIHPIKLTKFEKMKGVIRAIFKTFF